jgi:hypothetical protein
MLEKTLAYVQRFGGISIGDANAQAAIELRECVPASTSRVCGVLVVTGCRADTLHRRKMMSLEFPVTDDVGHETIIRLHPYQVCR